MRVNTARKPLRLRSVTPKIKDSYSQQGIPKNFLHRFFGILFLSSYFESASRRDFASAAKSVTAAGSTSSLKSKVGLWRVAV